MPAKAIRPILAFMLAVADQGILYGTLQQRELIVRRGGNDPING